MLAILKDIFHAPQSLDSPRFFISLALLLQLEQSSTLGQRYLISVIENADRNGTDPVIGNKLQVLLAFFQPTWVLGDLPMQAICYLLARGVCGRFLAPLLALCCYVQTQLPKRLLSALIWVYRPLSAFARGCSVLRAPLPLCRQWFAGRSEPLPRWGA